ncbi:MAG: hypothetical protein QG670_472 [Thermoproteota archaeon]|nr:hypothetical protein [Thermoproteota archaeon]
MVGEASAEAVDADEDDFESLLPLVTPHILRTVLRIFFAHVLIADSAVKNSLHHFSQESLPIFIHIFGSYSLITDVVVDDDVREHGLEVQLSHVLVKANDWAEDESTFILSLNLISSRTEPWESAPLRNQKYPSSRPRSSVSCRFSCQQATSRMWEGPA